MPRYTCATACPWRSALTILAAVSLAVPQKTGSARAGKNRATASTQMFGAMAASALAAANKARMAANSLRLSRWASAAVSGGPASMTVKANSVISCPALEIDTSRSLASPGSRPTIKNSVVTIRKAEVARINVPKVARRSVAKPRRGRSTAVMQAVPEIKVLPLY
ncbi:hypothetical protein D3C79_851670 [compost metagenome]